MYMLSVNTHNVIERVHVKKQLYVHGAGDIETVKVRTDLITDQ
jgi:hypothetical protein